MTAANMLAAVSAALTANLIVFRLRGPALMLYAAVSLTSGAICGLLAGSLRTYLMPVIGCCGKGYLRS